jgi:hypothetical protein
MKLIVKAFMLAAILTLPAARAAAATGAVAVAAPAPAVSNAPEPIGKFLDSHREQYRGALKKAKAWVDNLAVDPLELRQHNVKGKKKLAECLDFYVRLSALAEPAEKEKILADIKKRAAIVGEKRYHDLDALSTAFQLMKVDLAPAKAYADPKKPSP